ncbi:MAG: hypothetical protein JO218_10400 [Burkholderiales bacterium]|nr:hypothetical protein [Burkholderiales bacterium]
MKRAAIALIASFTATAAFAADAPKPKCEKPDVPNKLTLSSELATKAFQRHMNQYKDCINAFVAEQKAIADTAFKAGNDAVNEYNAFAKEVQEATAGE